MKNWRMSAAVLGMVVAAAPCVWGQMHKVAKPQQVVRAVGVYEWTGDMAKPTASRLIPVSLYINGSLEDAGVYLSRPVPFALESGNVYELRKAGVDEGWIDLEFARKLQTADGDEDGAWFGYGSFKALAPVKKGPALRQAKTLAKIEGSDDDSRPHLVRRNGGQAQASTGSTPADDPDRPTMTRRTSTTDSGTSAGTTTASTASADENNPADDPDRPTLKRRTPEEAKKAKAEAQSSAAGAVESLNDDPNRPKLAYGRPAGLATGMDLPKLVGMPVNLRQMVAVSDAVDRDPHDFSRPWASTAERASVLAKMETMARAKLTEYGGQAAPVTPAPVPVAKKTVHGRTRHTTAAAGPPPVALMDEQLRGYTLSYGGAATYVFTAHTAGSGTTLRYVTVVTQADDLGELKPALQSVTDADHLDRTPEMKFVDVVDADASNRASLLFELRGQNSRQFVLYRVIAAEAQLIFAGGTMQ